MSRRAQLIALASSFGVVSFLTYLQSRGGPVSPESEADLNDGTIRSRVIDIARKELGIQDALKYGPSRDNWCGNFNLWVLQQAGLASGSTPHWRWCLDLPTTDNPQPGDIAFFGPPNNHESIIVSVTDETVTTIDGNQEAEHGPDKGLVMRKTRPRSKVVSFHTIGPLIQASTPAEGDRLRA